ncbi:hypothetical protein C2G38_2043609 [Gigaspora rosea]|uniref:Uncharacterized protein n=1 Tax=Gigaspora rosea TaxID=44941 RepID=A0A397UJJ4_9GLOM|nr:hypothetical protein C2G38_2043609 [Gigaspora rosea]
MVSHAINRYVKLGFNLYQGTDIENAIKGISGTRVAHLEPNRIKGTSKKKFSLPGNSNWFEWHWPIEGEFAGYILARSMPNIGNWKSFSPTQLSKLYKTEITKPYPQFSDHSIPETDWHIPLPHISRLKRNELVNILQEKMTQEILSLDINADERVDTANLHNMDELSNILLPASWALKETQKFGIKGKGKCISKNVVPLLEAFFFVGDANKSNRYTAEDMLNELHSMAREGLLEDDEIPKLTTISNWISGYAKKHRQDLAKQSIEASEAY